MMYYQTLGLKRRASQDEIRKAYHSVAIRVHPDKPGGSVELFQAAQAAYEVLSNATTRATYDAELDRRRAERRGHKRPPKLECVRHPVHYKLADDEYYTFETSPDRLKCTFKHGDIVSLDNKLGCFVGLAGDDFLYWCVDGQTHASKLCQRGSFGMDSVRVVTRANFRSLHAGHLWASAVPRVAGFSAVLSRRGSTAGESDAAGTARSCGGATARRQNGRPSEAERLRQNIMRREMERHIREKMAALVELEKEQRACLMGRIEAALSDKLQEIRDEIDIYGL